MAKPQKSLMAGLYFPAVLGAGLVFILTRLALLFPTTRDPSRWWFGYFFESVDVVFRLAVNDYAILWGTALLILFSASFVVTDELPPGEYTAGFLLMDLLEVVLIFFAYWLLGLADTTKTTEAPFFPGVYLIMAAILAIDEAWSRRMPRTSDVQKSRERSRSVAAVRLIGIVGFFLAGCYASYPPNESSHRGSAFALFLLILTLYLFSYFEPGRQLNSRISQALHLD